MSVVPRHFQVSEVGSELKAMYSLGAVVGILRGTVASLTGVLPGFELIEPRVVVVGQRFVLETKNSLDAAHAPGVAGPMKAEGRPVVVLGPRDLNWFGAEEGVVPELLESKVAELALDFVMEAMHSLETVAAVEAEQKPKEVEVGLVLEPVAMLVEGHAAVVAEPMEVVAGILAEPAEPKEVGVFAAAVLPMEVGAENLFAVPVPMRAEAVAALVLEVDPKVAAFAADWPAHEFVPRVADIGVENGVALEAEPMGVVPVLGLVLALETDPRRAAFVNSKYL